MEAIKNEVPWYDRLQVQEINRLERFMLFFIPMEKTIEGNTTVFYKTFRGRIYVLDVIDHQFF